MNKNSELKEVSADIKELHDSGYALVHMLEHKVLINNDADQVANSYTLKTLKRIDGEAVEKYHIFREFNKTIETGFVAMPVSSIKPDVPMRLFDHFNSTGYLVDGRNVDYVYVSPTIIENKDSRSPNGITIKTEDIVYKHIHELQFPGTYDKIKTSYFIDIPIEASAEKNHCCKAAINNIWSLIKGEGTQQDLMNYYNATSRVDDKNPMMTEHLVNVHGLDKIKALVHYSDGHEINYSNKSHGSGKGLIDGIALKGLIKDTFNKDVPMLHYDKVRNGNLTTQPELRELVLNKEKIVRAILELGDDKAASYVKYCSIALCEDLSAHPAIKTMFRHPSREGGVALGVAS